MRVRDLRKPLPFEPGVFDAVYANHVFEHLTPSEAAGLAAELNRVLKAELHASWYPTSRAPPKLSAPPES